MSMMRILVLGAMVFCIGTHCDRGEPECDPWGLLGDSFRVQLVGEPTSPTVSCDGFLELDPDVTLAADNACPGLGVELPVNVPLDPSLGARLLESRGDGPLPDLHSVYRLDADGCRGEWQIFVRYERYATSIDPYIEPDTDGAPWTLERTFAPDDVAACPALAGAAADPAWRGSCVDQWPARLLPE